MVDNTNEIKLLQMSSYNGILANLWRIILRKSGIKTESKLVVLIAKIVSDYVVKNRNLNSKEIRKLSPSVLKNEAMSENMTFKSFVNNLKVILKIKRIKFHITLIDVNDEELECEYEIDI